MEEDPKTKTESEEGGDIEADENKILASGREDDNIHLQKKSAEKTQEEDGGETTTPPRKISDSGKALLVKIVFAGFN